MTVVLVPVLLVVVVIASDLWVLTDASRCAREGAPVYVRIGSFTVDTPLLWFVLCLVLWILFFPLYLTSRSAG